jgi:hypothetical protein
MLRRMSAQRRHASTSVRGAVRALASSMARGRPYLSFGRSCNPNFVASPSLRRRLDFRSDSGPHRDHRTRCVNAPAMQTRVVYKRPAAKTPECRACVRDSVDAAKHFERVWTLPARCLHRLFRGLNADGNKATHWCAAESLQRFADARTPPRDTTWRPGNSADKLCVVSRLSLSYASKTGLARTGLAPSRQQRRRPSMPVLHLWDRCHASLPSTDLPRGPRALQRPKLPVPQMKNFIHTGQVVLRGPKA